MPDHGRPPLAWPLSGIETRARRLGAVWFRGAKRARHARRRYSRTVKRLRREARLFRRLIRHRAARSRRAARSWWHGLARRLRPYRRATLRASAGAARLLRTVGSGVPGEADACPACRSSDLCLLDPLRLRHALGGYRYGFVTGCRECGLVFANPVRTEAELAAFYATTGTWAASRQDLDPPAGEPEAVVRLLLGDVALDVTSPVPGAAVLDIGCGDGRLLNCLQRLGWRTYGIEPAVKVAFSRHEELRDIPDRPTFQLVILRHVLEHLRDPLDMLRRVERALLPGGVLFISVPDLDGLARHGDYGYCISDIPHISAFSRAGLSSLLARAGLQMVTPVTGDGMPRPRARTEVFARKEAPHAPPARPLDTAQSAIAAYRRSRRAGVAARWLPVRLQAGLLNMGWPGTSGRLGTR